MSSTKPSPTRTNSPLHPSLQVALASLDVPLDAELERYRRHRKRTSPPPPPPASQPVIVEGQLESSQTSSADLSPWDQTSEDLSGQSDASNSPFSPDVSSGAEPQPAVERSDSSATPDTYLESAERLRQGSQTEDRSEAGLTPGVDVSAADLSDSSRDSQRKDPKFTALGVGSVLLFLAATATLGYVLVNPESLSQLGLERLFGGESVADAEGEETTTSADSDSRPTRLPTSPDLAAEEFIQLDLSTLSSLDPETRSPIVTPPPTPQAPTEPTVTAPTPSEATETAENTLDNISALLTPESTGDSQAETAPETPTETPTQVPEPEQVPAEESSRPTPTIDRDDDYTGFVFVVVDYNNQVSTLDQVREVVPDAYLREFPDGVKVQVGAFDDTAGADGLVNRLQEDGISAQVYQAR